VKVESADKPNRFTDILVITIISEVIILNLFHYKTKKRKT